MKLEASKQKFKKSFINKSIFFYSLIPLRFWLLIMFTTKPSSLMMKLSA